MNLKRLWMLLIVGIVVSGCGKKRPVEQWPAYITGFENFSADQKSTFSSYVDALNTEAGKTIVSTSPLDEGYPITVKLGPSPADKPNQAGFAVRTDDDCHVDISTQLFDKSREAYQKSVFLHELGHCAGLQHIGTLGAVMYPIAQPFTTYTADAIEQFINSFLSSAQPKE